ncbi:MAG TPA: hypothetical protein VFS77_03070 [Pyrinomonadaceae bacterium]|nr:hypothetical protein [Pyrinomonadaceae bacterium]
MNENRTIHLVDIPIGGKEGSIWNRLHGEREDICEILLKQQSGPAFQTHRDYLQARLRRVDDALDRLMSGSYGHCSSCGHSIGDVQLAIDPATALCRECDGTGPDSSSTAFPKAAVDGGRVALWS